jgi:hypothetical protein
MSTSNAFSDYTEAAVLNHIFGSMTMAKPAGLYLALMTSACTDSTSGAEATAMTNYARKAITFSAAVSPGGTITNNNTVDFGIVTGSGCTVTNWAIFDAVTGGNMLIYGDFPSPQPVSVGIDVVVTPNSVTIALG